VAGLLLEGADAKAVTRAIELALFVEARLDINHAKHNAILTDPTCPSGESPIFPGVVVTSGALVDARSSGGTGRAYLKHKSGLSTAPFARWRSVYSVHGEHH
jgi:hypothetical protein